MSGDILEVVADRLHTERLGPLTRLVFSIQSAPDDELGDRLIESVASVVAVVVPTEAVPALIEALSKAGPAKIRIRGRDEVEMHLGRDLACRGKC